VHGFFANGGQTCYVSAVSNASADEYPLPDAAGSGTLLAKARRTGALNPQVEVKSVASNIVKTANVYVIEAPLTATAAQNSGTVRIANAQRFQAGDVLTIVDTSNPPRTQQVTVAYTEPTAIHLTTRLGNNFTTANNAKVKFAPLAADTKSFRVEGATGPAGPSGLVVGSIITLTQPAPGGGQPSVQTTVVTAVRAERISANLTTYRVTVKDALAGFALDTARPIDIVSEEFTLSVQRGAATPTEYADLSMSAAHPRSYAKIVNNDPAALITLEPISGNNTALPDNRPIQAAFAPLGGGDNHRPSLLTVNDYKRVLGKLEAIKDISIVAIPDRTDAAVQGALLAHCSTLYDRVAIFDAAKGSDPTTIQTQQSSLQDTKGFGALYYPWIEVSSAKTGGGILVPPSGYVAGIYARTDLTRGGFKAPAGTDATINEALAVETALSDAQQGILNLKGINVIRVFRTRGRPTVWGARTTSEDTNWQYVNIRRLFIFLERSIQVGIRTAVFEPNNPALWQRLKRTITAFLTQQWRDGALFGVKAEHAFYVRIDEALNPDNERALGRLYIEIGLRPSYPAEFIIVRIGIWQGGTEISES
jgi:hypothetical protein